MSEDYIIEYCAPTLAGIKTGSIFTCPCTDREALTQSIRQLNRLFRDKGLKLIPLRFSDKKALIYLYRPKRLWADLADAAAAALLKQQGYNTDTCQHCVAQLARRLKDQRDFPHEIGLFLGYPPEDVCGFIENRACGCKCVGCWKVYGDEAAARKKFNQYKKCTRIYREQWQKGRTIERLAVAQ
jgi:hypothetical protein